MEVLGLRSMATQWCQLWAKIGDILNKFLWENHTWFWSLGSHESNASRGLQFGVEIREIWLIEIRLRKVHGSIVKSTLSHNWYHLYWSYLVKSHMVFKIIKSRIQCFERITIQSWNEGDMAKWSNTMERACCYRIAYGSNSF